MTMQMSTLTEKLEGLKGNVVVPDDPGYEQARQIWNAMIDRRPAMIVQCSDPDDVAPAIGFARRNKLEVSIRGGGHNIAGSSLCDHGLLGRAGIWCRLPGGGARASASLAGGRLPLESKQP